MMQGELHMLSLTLLAFAKLGFGPQKHWLFHGLVRFGIRRKVVMRMPTL